MRLDYLSLCFDWLPGVRDSPEQRAAKRGVFTGCQFGGNNPALRIRVLGKDKVVYWEFISCTGNPHCTEGKKGHGVYTPPNTGEGERRGRGSEGGEGEPERGRGRAREERSRKGRREEG